jgi:hypothetical protein
MANKKKKQEKTTFEEWKQDATQTIAWATRIAGGGIGLETCPELYGTIFLREFTTWTADDIQTFLSHEGFLTTSDIPRLFDLPRYRQWEIPWNDAGVEMGADLRANAIVLHTRGLNSTQRANAPSDSHQTTRVAGTCRDTPRTKRVHGVTGSNFPFSMTLSFPAMVPGHGRRRSKLQSSPFSPAKGPP